MPVFNYCASCGAKLPPESHFCAKCGASLDSETRLANKSSTFMQRGIENNQGSISGTLEAVDGTTTPIQYRLIKENGQWKILYIRVNPSGIVIKPEDRAHQAATH